MSDRDSESNLSNEDLEQIDRIINDIEEKKPRGRPRSEKSNDEKRNSYNMYMREYRKKKKEETVKTKENIKFYSENNVKAMDLAKDLLKKQKREISELNEVVKKHEEIKQQYEQKIIGLLAQVKKYETLINRYIS